MTKELHLLESADLMETDPIKHEQFIRRKTNVKENWLAYLRSLESVAPEYVRSHSGQTASYHEIQRSLNTVGSDCAWVEFFHTGEELISFVIRSHEHKPYTIRTSLPEKEIYYCLQCYIREVVRYQEYGDIGQRWQELAAKLLQNVLPLLEGVKKVCIASYGLLSYLPIHALPVGQDILLDRFMVSYVPSLSVLHRVLNRATVDTTMPSQPSLVLGYTPNDFERDIFEGEARAVAGLLNAKIYTGPTAVRGQLPLDGARLPILHLSCHGYFDSQSPLASGVLLADEILTVRDLISLRLNVNLVTLSACQTALNLSRPGMESLGLPHALLSSGTSSVLAGLWSVDAKVTAKWMENFYSYLSFSAQGLPITKIEAWNQAVQTIRRQYPHPYYWAPFVLVGDWR